MISSGLHQPMTSCAPPLVGRARTTCPDRSMKPWSAHSPTLGWRMRAAQIRKEIVADSVALAWDQWSQLGVSAASPPQREERAADPEALLLFTLELGRNDPRLFDEVLDWLALN